MIQIAMNTWLAFNVIFGLWSARNWLMFFYAAGSGRKFKQSDLGKILDMLILVSIASQCITVWSPSP